MGFCTLMGTFCSINTGAESDEHDKDSEDSPPRYSRAKPSRQSRMTAKAPEPKLRGQRPWQDKRDEDFRFQFQDDMVAHAAQSATSNEASAKEAEANRLIAYMREEDEATFKERSLHSGQHFLDVREVLEDARLFHVARMMPKGAHLHIHFNSTLLPDVLLGYAKEMPNMYIWSDHQLLEDSDFRDCKLEFSLRNLEQVRKDMHKKAAESDDYYLQAMLDDAKGLSDETAKIHAYDALGPNIFSSSYKHGPKDKKQEVEEMRYQYFRERWDEEARGNCDEWLIQKLTFSKEEVRSFYDEPNHVDIEPKPVVVDSVPSNTENPTSNGGMPQAFNEQEWIPETAKKISSSEFKHVRDSARKAWTAFNGRTKMMKGLFNYESAFRQYTRKCLEEFVRDNVQYAEIRPNFMQTNQILNDTAETKIDNFGTMELIIGEYTKFMKEIGDMRQDGTIIDDEQHRPALSGMKVIYCTPRSFSRDAVKKALDECIEMKKRWPDYIAGFDLVGEEAFRELHPLKYFEDEFQYFKQRCKEEGFDIPFLFHCGETPDDLEGNLETALELDAKRIGHGYALPQKVEVLRAMRSKNICVETCPISNMVLGLAERMDQHSVYRLLEEKMHCAVSSDNGTLFKSTLSHDFYEVMAGHQKINLYGWKQLARWSIEHSVLSEEERRRMLTEWEKRWQDFINALIEASGSMSPVGSISELRRARDIVEATRLAKLDKANGSTSTILSDS